MTGAERELADPPGPKASRWSNRRIPDAVRTTQASQSDRKKAKTKRAKRWVLGLTVAGTAIFLVVRARISLSDGNFVVAALYAGLAMTFLIQVPASLPRRPFTPRAVSGLDGTIFRPDRRVDILSVASLSIGFVVAVAWAFLGTTGKVSEPYFINEMDFGFLLMCGGAAVVCAIFLWLMIKRRGASYIQLTPAGFVFAEGILGTRGMWSEVVEMNDYHPGTPLAPDAITLVAADGRTASVQRAGFYVPDGDVLRELIRFYWQNPQQRAELTDGRSLIRLRDRQFTPN